MPELPDVEGFRRFFDDHAHGKTIAHLKAEGEIVRNSSPQGLGRSLKGARFQTGRRYGKWLICPTDRGSALLLHFGMTGELVWAGSSDDLHPHDRLTIELYDGELRYRAMRKLGGAWLKRDWETLEEVVGTLGPDADHVSADELAELLGRRRGGLKSALMDQSFVAGLGNLTVDEILWHARLAPQRSTRELEDVDVTRLYEAIDGVLRDSKKAARVPAKEGWITKARAEDAPQCPRCGKRLSRDRIAGRTTFWCSSCQS